MMINLAVALGGLTFILLAAKVIYNVYLSPLRHIPGPKLNAISRLPYLRHHLNGSAAVYSKSLHDKYGEVVRFSPNEVSFINAQAWPDIYGARVGRMKNHASMLKDPAWYPTVIGPPSLILADDYQHGRLRKLFAPAFSDRALAQQEPILQLYADQLIHGLKEQCRQSKSVDMTKWFNWITFDIISDIVFGEPFGCLRNHENHRYVDMLIKRLHSSPFFYAMFYYPISKFFSRYLFDQSLLQARKDYAKWVDEQVTARCAKDTDHPDFIKFVLENSEKSEDGVLSHEELVTNVLMFLGAGSETSSTTLTAATYLLSQHPEVLKKLQQEVRQRWKSYEEITSSSAVRAPYLSAVITETLRILPPASVGFQRRVGQGGGTISSYHIPEGTAVSVSHFGAYRSDRNFSLPDEYIPERWLDDGRFVKDNKDVFKPFSHGPRDCAGKNLANAELRLILAKFVWTFDFELDARSSGWFGKLEVRNVWTKPELLIRLREV